MSRALKDELQPQAQTPQTMQGFQPTPQANSIQIQMDEAMQDNLVQVILDDYSKMKDDRDSRDYGTTSKGEKLNFTEFMKRLKDLYSGYRIPKSIPWKFCSNRSLRIGTAILEMLVSRLFGAIWNEDLSRWRAGKVVDVPKAERVSKFMGWWLRVWAPMRDFVEGWVKSTAGFGDALVETSWEVDELMTGEVEQIPTMDPSGMQVMQPQNKINRIEKTKSRVIPKESVYLMKGSKDIQHDPICIEEDILFKDLEDMEKANQCVNVTTKLLQVTPVHVPTTVSDPIKIEIIKRIKLRNMPIKVVRWYGHYDVDNTGFDDSVRMMVAKDHQIYLGGVRMRDVTKSGKRPLEFSKYNNRLECIDELFGEGVLEQVRELAEEVDAIFNQLSDANTISILRPVFYDPSGDLEAPTLELGPNRMFPVSDPQRNVFIPEYNIDTNRLINAINLVSQFIEKLTAASSYVMGREDSLAGGSGTATRTQAIIQSAEIRFARPVERLKSSAARIITQHLDLIQKNIPPGMEQRVIGEKGEPLFQENELTEDGLNGEFDCYLLDDPTMGSKQTQQQVSSMMYSLLMQNPLVGSDPVKIYKITAALLKSVDWDPQEYLGPEPDMDNIDSPEDENTLVLQGQFKRVVPQMYENHIEHIQKHQEMFNSPTLQQVAQIAPNMIQNVLQYMQAHIQGHTEMMQQMMALMQKVNGGGKGGGGINKGGDGRGSNPGDSKVDSGARVETTSGPLGQAMQTQRSGMQQSPQM